MFSSYASNNFLFEEISLDHMVQMFCSYASNTFLFEEISLDHMVQIFSSYASNNFLFEESWKGYYVDYHNNVCTCVLECMICHAHVYDS